MKYKKKIEKVYRLKNSSLSRYGNLSLDKNERVSIFEKKFFKSFLNKLSSEKISLYPEVSTLYHSLAKHHKLKEGNFVLTNGIDGAIKSCFDLFVSKNDKVIILKPTFAMVDIYCDLSEAKKIEINYDRKLNLDLEKLIKSIKKDISLIIIANPNSPTGTIISNENIKRIIKKAHISKVPVLIDEAYYEFSNFSVLPLLKKFNNLIIARTFSKAFGLAGLRVGYIVTNYKISKLFFNLKPMYEVNSVGILACNLLLKDYSILKKYIKETKKGEELLIKFLERNKIGYIKTFANFIYINFEKRINYIHTELLKNKIATKKGLNIKGYKNYLRITTGPIKETQKLILKLRKLFK